MPTKSATKPTAQELLKLRRYDPQRKPQPDQFLFHAKGKKIGSLQNLVIVSGKQKNGKSRYISAIIGAALSGSPLFSLSVQFPLNRDRLALFDTEQGDFDFYRQIETIKAFSGLSSLQNFDAYNTREDDPGDSLKMIEAYLTENPQCSILVIDGLLDLILDFNNVIESKRLINFLKKITKQFNVLIIAVIHRGKGNDTNIGNLGAMADRLAQSVLKVEKDKERGVYNFSPEFMRSDEEFDPVSIWYNGHTWEEVPYLETSTTPVKPIARKPDQYDNHEHTQAISEIFSPGQYYTYDQLIESIKEFYGMGRNWAVSCIAYLKSIDLVFKTSHGYSNNSQANLKFKK